MVKANYSVAGHVLIHPPAWSFAQLVLSGKMAVLQQNFSGMFFQAWPYKKHIFCNFHVHCTLIGPVILQKTRGGGETPPVIGGRRPGIPHRGAG